MMSIDVCDDVEAVAFVDPLFLATSPLSGTRSSIHLVFLKNNRTFFPSPLPINSVTVVDLRILVEYRVF